VEDMKVKGMEQEFSPDAKLRVAFYGVYTGCILEVRALAISLTPVGILDECGSTFQYRFGLLSTKLGLGRSIQVSPVDGKILRLGELKGSSAMIEQVKGFSYSASSLLGANSSLHEATNEDRNNQYPEQSLTEDSSRKSWWHISFASPKVRNSATWYFL
ncbi:hypothetical protein GW17_00014040, partial [Ensete ventricosum]